MPYVSIALDQLHTAISAEKAAMRYVGCLTVEFMFWLINIYIPV